MDKAQDPFAQLEEQELRPLAGVLSGSGARGMAVGCLRLEVRRPASVPGPLCLGLTFLLRGEPCTLFLVGRVGIEPMTALRQARSSLEESGLLLAVVINIPWNPSELL